MEIYRSSSACGCLRCRFRGIMGAVVLMTVGALFLLENFHVYDLDFNHTWPLLLISIGVVKMLQRSASTEGHVQPPVMGAPFPTSSVPPMTSPPVPPMPGTQSSESSSEFGSEVRHE
jgi:cell wall-active antibiotic response 4TMS protein YvqF